MLGDDGPPDVVTRFLHDGVVVQPVADVDALHTLRRRVVGLAASWLGGLGPAPGDEGAWLDEFHRHSTSGDLNDLRVHLMTALADDPDARRWILAIARPSVEALVGNELAIQRRPNLSVQVPHDADSVLSLHADTWSGHSPFELVVWIPLVDCWGTKSMYMVPTAAAGTLWERFAAFGGRTTDDLFDVVADEVVWIRAAYGQVVLFDQSVPHGNRVNREDSTRWSINCRFTGLFTPYADKGLGDFFTPVLLRPLTARALGLDVDGWR